MTIEEMPPGQTFRPYSGVVPTCLPWHLTAITRYPDPVNRVPARPRRAIADGRLHTAAVCLLAPHLTAQNVDQLIAAMTHRREGEIKAMLKEWFPGPAA